MNRRRALATGAGTGIAAGIAAGVAYSVERAVSRHWRVDERALAEAGRTLPADLRHHFVPMSDGGRVHAVERGEGATTVLVHGVLLGVATWAPQLRGLQGRVVAVSQRGHGQSRAGTEGFAFDRLVRDLLEVFDALEVRRAVLVAHSMGGMVAQLLAVEHAGALDRHVERLVLVATGPRVSMLGPFAPVVVATAQRSLAAAERRGRGPFHRGTTPWAARLSFGAHPRAVDIELTRGMLDAMSPSAAAALLPELVAFDVRDRLGSVVVPTHVICGTRDLLTPARTARAIANRVPGARLTLLPGCGHMVMLERPDELCDLLR